MANCELLGTFGIFVQMLLGFLSLTTMVAKKFFPGETRTWKVFLMDMSKQVFTAFYAHFLNMVLAVWLQKLAKDGDTCVWYFVNHFIDTFAGIGLIYLLHSAVENFAIKNGIEILKSGVYTENATLDQLENPDKHINYKIYFIQMIVYAINVTLVKLFLFGIILFFNKPLLAVGQNVLSIFDGHPDLELVFIMIILPVTFNTIQYWVIDYFIRGNKHVIKRAKTLRMSQVNNARDFRSPDSFSDQVFDQRSFDDSPRSFSQLEQHQIQKRPSRLNRQIEEGVFNIKEDDYDEQGNLKDEQIVSAKEHVELAQINEDGLSKDAFSNNALSDNQRQNID